MDLSPCDLNIIPEFIHQSPGSLNWLFRINKETTHFDSQLLYDSEPSSFSIASPIPRLTDRHSFESKISTDKKPLTFRWHLSNKKKIQIKNEIFYRLYHNLHIQICVGAYMVRHRSGFALPYICCTCIHGSFSYARRNKKKKKSKLAQIGFGPSRIEFTPVKFHQIVCIDDVTGGQWLNIHKIVCIHSFTVHQIFIFFTLKHRHRHEFFIQNIIQIDGRTATIHHNRHIPFINTKQN